MQPAYTCLRCLKTQAPQLLRRPTLQVARLKASRSFTSRPTESPPKINRSKLATSRSKAASTVAFQSQTKDNDALSSVPRGGRSAQQPPPPERLLLQPNNLFHSFSNSPSPEIRKRAAFMKHNAYCPHPNHQATRTPVSPEDPEARKLSGSQSLPPANVKFECPDCGIPISCCEEHWADDYESHVEICDTLREINEDDHDLRSGRFFTEFEYPGVQLEEAMVNMTNWDTLLYTREFNAINDERHMRQATRLLTYPMTIASVLSELSPYNMRNKRITPEGIKSLTGEWCFLH